MEPNAVVAGFIAAAVAATTELVGTAVKDAYQGMKGFLVRKFGAKGQSAVEALEQVEKNPNSDARKAVAKEELSNAGALTDPEVVSLVEKLHALLKADPAGSQTLNIIATGYQAIAAKEIGNVIHGDVHGNVNN